MGVAKAIRRSAFVVLSGLTLTLGSTGVASAGLGLGHIKGKGKGHDKHQCGEHEVSGDFVVEEGPGFPGVKPVADDLCIIELPATFHLAGDLDGSFFALFEIEHYGPCGEYAEEYFYADGTYEGSVLGAEGTFTYTFEGTIDMFGQATGELIIDEGSGTGDLEDLEGSITLSGPAGVSGSYSGTVSFE